MEKATTIVIPTMNEQETIGELIEEILTTTRHASIETEILVVDDGSQDDTREIVKKLSGTYPVFLICRDNQRGLASAVLDGASRASHDVIVVIDADKSHPAAVIPHLCNPLFADEQDLVIGSRYTQGGTTPGWPLKRKIASRLASFPAQLMTGCDDPLGGFFAARKRDLLSLGSEVEGYKICLELLFKKSDVLRVAEFPIAFVDREAGMSKMDHGVIFAYLRQLYRLCGFSSDRKVLKCSRVSVLLGLVVDLLTFFSLSSFGLHPTISQFVAFLVGGISVLALHSRTTEAVFILPAPLKKPSTLIWLFSLPFLRAGILATILRYYPDHFFLPGTTAAIFTGLVHFFLLPQFFQCKTRNNPPQTYRKISFRLFLISLVFISILLRLFFAGGAPLIQEEAYYWNFAKHLDIGYLDHPPMTAYLIALGTTLFGNNEFGVRFGAQLCWCITAIFLFQSTRERYGRDVGLGALALAAFLPFIFGFGLIITPDAPLITCWAGALYFSRKAMVEEQRSYWLPTGILLGLGLFSKYTIGLLGLSWLCFLLLDRKGRRMLLTPAPWGAASLALIIFSPVIIWNYQHEWASFLFQTRDRLVASSEFSTHELFLTILVLLTPVGMLSGFLSLTKKQDNSRQDDVRGNVFDRICILLPLFIFILFSLSKEIKFNWAGPLWLAAIPFMATTIVGISRQNRSRTALFQKSWLVTLLIFLSAYSSILVYMGLGIPGLRYQTASPYFGWKNYAPQIVKIANIIEQSTGELPEIVGTDQYRSASGLTFYGTKKWQIRILGEEQPFQPAVVGRDVFETGALMYHYWYPGQGKLHTPMIAVSSDKNDLHPTRLPGLKSSELGQIFSLSTTENGVVCLPLYLRILNIHPPIKKIESLVPGFQFGQ